MARRRPLSGLYRHYRRTSLPGNRPSGGQFGEFSLGVRMVVSVAGTEHRSVPTELHYGDASSWEGRGPAATGGDDPVPLRAGSAARRYISHAEKAACAAADPETGERGRAGSASVPRRGGQRRGCHPGEQPAHARERRGGTPPGAGDAAALDLLSVLPLHKGVRRPVVDAYTWLIGLANLSPATAEVAL